MQHTFLYNEQQTLGASRAWRVVMNNDWQAKHVQTIYNPNLIDFNGKLFCFVLNKKNVINVCLFRLSQSFDKLCQQICTENDTLDWKQKATLKTV